MDKESIIFGFIVGVIVGIGAICAVIAGAMNGLFVD
jgi:hypothetical protein